MKMIRTVFCLLLLMTAAFAVQRAPGQTDQAPAAPQANPQDQNPPSQAQPPDTRAPQPNDQGPQSQPQAQPQAPQTAQPPSIDEQVAVLTQELNLNNDQQTKVKSILVDQRQQAMGVVGDQNMSRADKIEKIHSIRETTISKVRDSLNDDQKKKLDQMLQGQQQAPGNAQPEPGNSPPK